MNALTDPQLAELEAFLERSAILREQPDLEGEDPDHAAAWQTWGTTIPPTWAKRWLSEVDA